MVYVPNQPYEEKEFVEKIVQINRVSKKTSGGNRFSFTALVVVGDGKGQVGVALGKAPDVTRSIQKATQKAKKKMIMVPIINGTIPHEIRIKFGAAKILLKPAREGSGVRAGIPVRAVVEAAGIHNLTSKLLGTSNKISNVYATIEALKNLRQFKEDR